MKKATCRQLRGACDEVITGETPEEMGENCKIHVMNMLQQGDEAHKAAVGDMQKLSKEEQAEWYEEFKKNFDALPEA